MNDPVIYPTEAEDRADEHKRKDQARIVLALMLGFLIVLSVFTVGAVLVVRNVTSDLNTIETFSNRNDCARSINAEQSAVLRRRDSLQAQVTQTITELLVTPIEQRGGLVPQLATINDEFDKAEKAVEALPPVDKEVERRCPAVDE